jgi:hypothetical protein
MTQISDLIDRFQDVERLYEVDKIPVLRQEIVELIREGLNDSGKNLDDVRPKKHFANAISWLSLNVHSLIQPSTAWLRLCLMDLENAITPATLRSLAESGKNSQVTELSYEQLLDALHSVEVKIRELGQGNQP